MKQKGSGERVRVCVYVCETERDFLRMLVLKIIFMQEEHLLGQRGVEDRSTNNIQMKYYSDRLFIGATSYICIYESSQHKRCAINE